MYWRNAVIETLLLIAPSQPGRREWVSAATSPPVLMSGRHSDNAVAVFRRLGYQVKDAAVPFGDPNQASMATVVTDRAEIAAQAFADVDVIVLPTMDSSVPTVKEAAKNIEQGVSAEFTILGQLLWPSGDVRALWLRHPGHPIACRSSAKLATNAPSLMSEPVPSGRNDWLEAPPRLVCNRADAVSPT